MSHDWRDTYGNSPAALRVVEIIREIPDERLRKKAYRRVGTILMNFNKSLKEVNSCIRTDSLRETLILLLRDKQSQLVRECKTPLPDNLRSYLICLIRTISRKALQEEI